MKVKTVDEWKELLRGRDAGFCSDALLSSLVGYKRAAGWSDADMNQVNNYSEALKRITEEGGA